jgi:hypothetical protein
MKSESGSSETMAVWTRRYKDSYTPTFSMVGVAGAIIAQIALTALSLPNLDDTHWTARASFVIGLVAGSLAVFCCCVLQSKMSALHTAHAVRRWLTRRRDNTYNESDKSKLKDRIRNPDAKYLRGLKEVLSRYNEMFNERTVHL